MKMKEEHSKDYQLCSCKTELELQGNPCNRRLDCELVRMNRLTSIVNSTETGKYTLRELGRTIYKKNTSL